MLATLSTELMPVPREAGAAVLCWVSELSDAALLTLLTWLPSSPPPKPATRARATVPATTSGVLPRLRGRSATAVVVPMGARGGRSVLVWVGPDW